MDDYSYSPEDQETWQKFFAAMERAWDNYSSAIHPYYLQHVERLEAFRNKIPSLQEINALLADIGWSAAYVEGLAPPWAIARSLHERVLPISRSIRKPHEIFFASEPDLIHDIFGHLPSVFDRHYRQLLERWSAAAASYPISAIDQTNYHLNKVIVQSQGQIEAEGLGFLEKAAAGIGDFISLYPSPSSIFEKTYFWIFEFGLIKVEKGVQVLGAGLLSSLSELDRIYSGHFTVDELNSDSILSSYHISSLQDSYLVASSIEKCQELIDTMMMLREGPQLEVSQVYVHI